MMLGYAEMCVCVCVLMCEREGERETSHFFEDYVNIKNSDKRYDKNTFSCTYMQQMYISKNEIKNESIRVRKGKREF